LRPVLRQFKDAKDAENPHNCEYSGMLVIFVINGDGQIYQTCQNYNEIEQAALIQKVRRTPIADQFDHHFDHKNQHKNDIYPLDNLIILWVLGIRTQRQHYYIQENAEGNKEDECARVSCLETTAD